MQEGIGTINEADKDEVGAVQTPEQDTDNELAEIQAEIDNNQKKHQDDKEDGI